MDVLGLVISRDESGMFYPVAKREREIDLVLVFNA